MNLCWWSNFNTMMLSFKCPLMGGGYTTGVLGYTRCYVHFQTRLWNTHKQVRSSGKASRSQHSLQIRLKLNYICHQSLQFPALVLYFISTQLVSNPSLGNSHKPEKLLAQAHATDWHRKQFILTAFWCRGTDTKCSQFLISNRLFKVSSFSVTHCSKWHLHHRL